MSEQYWYSRWEKETGSAGENGDLVLIVDKECNNNQAPDAYRQVFREIKMLMERSQQSRSNEIMSTLSNTAETENDYLYKHFATTLQANYDDIEGLYQKEVLLRKSLEEALSDLTLKKLQLEYDLKTLRNEHRQQQIEQHTQTKEVASRVIELEKRNQQLEQDLAEERNRQKEMEVLVQRLREQLKSKDAQLLSGAQHRQGMEMQMMDTHKELVALQTELTQKKNDLSQLAQLVLVVSTLPNARKTFTKCINDALSTQALQAILSTGSNHPQQQQQMPLMAQSLQLVRQALYQRQQQQQQQLQQQLQQQRQQQLQQQQQQHEQQQQQQQHRY